MTRKTAFVKVSGDVCRHGDFLEWVRDLSCTYFTVLCVGGGTQINKVFKERGHDSNHGPLGRETATFQQRQLARDILEENQVAVQDMLAARNICASVITPVLDLGTVLCHVNGDTMVHAAYLGYDTLFVVTTCERHEKKRKQFSHLPRVEIVTFDC